MAFRGRKNGPAGWYVPHNDRGNSKAEGKRTPADLLLRVRDRSISMEACGAPSARCKWKEAVWFRQWDVDRRGLTIGPILQYVDALCFAALAAR